MNTLKLNQRFRPAQTVSVLALFLILAGAALSNITRASASGIAAGTGGDKPYSGGDHTKGAAGQGEAGTHDIAQIGASAPDLKISSIRLSNTNPIRETDMYADITVTNGGGSPANDFTVRWVPDDSHSSTFPPEARIDQVRAGASFTVNIKCAQCYATTGTKNSFVLVDPQDKVRETSAGETNNKATLQVTVKPHVADVQITFTSVFVKDDLEVWPAQGNMYVDFKFYKNGVEVKPEGSQRWPSSGTKDVADGGAYTVDRVFILRGVEEDIRFSFKASGWEVDDVSDNDSMGAVSYDYGAILSWGIDTSLFEGSSQQSPVYIAKHSLQRYSTTNSFALTFKTDIIGWK